MIRIGSSNCCMEYEEPMQLPAQSGAISRGQRTRSVTAHCNAGARPVVTPGLDAIRRIIVRIVSAAGIGALAVIGTAVIVIAIAIIGTGIMPAHRGSLRD